MEVLMWILGGVGTVMVALLGWVLTALLSIKTNMAVLANNHENSSKEHSALVEWVKTINEKQQSNSQDIAVLKSESKSKSASSR